MVNSLGVFDGGQQALADVLQDCIINCDAVAEIEMRYSGRSDFISKLI
ncbi:hypothetical protein [Acidisoma cellulosilyticum]|nr:hypothetical protein [Acidisoma cellulosilyticum]